MRRVVVTGLGMVTPLGCGVEHNWKRLIAGESGAKKIDTFEVSDIACRIAGVIPVGDGTNGTYNADQWMVQTLIDYPKWLHAVARASLEFEDGDALWQLAVALGASNNKAEAEELLLKLWSLMMSFEN